MEGACPYLKYRVTNLCGDSSGWWRVLIFLLTADPQQKWWPSAVEDLAEPLESHCTMGSHAANPCRLSKVCLFLFVQEEWVDLHLVTNTCNLPRGECRKCQGYCNPHTTVPATECLHYFFTASVEDSMPSGPKGTIGLLDRSQGNRPFHSIKADHT